MGPTVNFLKFEFRIIVQDLLQTLCGRRLWELLGLNEDANTYKGCMEYKNEIYLQGCSVSVQLCKKHGLDKRFIFGRWYLEKRSDNSPRRMPSHSHTGTI